MSDGTTEPIPVTDDNGLSQISNLVCPVCGYDYVSVGGEPVAHGASFEGYDAGWGGRGPRLAIPMVGECGHRWLINIGFHKGQSAIFILLE